MLVLSRRVNERIVIGDDVVVTVLEVRSDNTVRIGIEAPRGVRIQREEIIAVVAEANRAAVASEPVSDDDAIASALGGVRPTVGD